MSKFEWSEMELCTRCHFADDNPDICNAFKKPREKPGPIYDEDYCSKYLRESKWERMPEKERQKIILK